MPEDAIITKQLTKVFGRYKAVDSLNLNIRDGEMFGLLGPNGAGKTTTVRMLCTLLEPTSGFASVSGYDITKQAAEVRKQIGVVSDGVLLYKDLTVEENLLFFAGLYGINRNDAREEIKELMDFFEFREKAKRLVGHLSTGWAKKAMVCAALLHDPSVLFLDEVTSGLDPQSAIALRRFTRKLCDQGVTTIWTTHYMEEPEKICDRIGVVHSGRMIQIGTPAELKRSVSEMSLIEIETPTLSEIQLERIGNIEGVIKTSYKNSVLKVSGEKSEALMENVMKTLLSEHVQIRSVNSKDPTLEEAFIHLTGGEMKLERAVGM
jgi:ABC-2 type transport system ATP-binding protein